MTDKEKIRTEIERLIELNAELAERHQFGLGKVRGLQQILSFIDSLPEEPELTPLEKEVVDNWTIRIDNKRIPITLKGDIKHKFRNEFHTMWQTVGEMQFANVAKVIMERLCLHFAAWGAYNLKDIGNISKEEKNKMDTEKLVSEGLEEAAKKYAKAKHQNEALIDIVSMDFKAGAQWHIGHSKPKKKKK